MSPTRSLDGFEASPVRAVMSSFDMIAVGANHSCAHQPGAELITCWGDNSHRQLNDGNSVANTLWRGLAAGGNTTCGIGVDSALTCWGAIPSRDASPAGEIAGPA